MNSVPMYCHLGGGPCEHAAIGKCMMGFPNLIACKSYWESKNGMVLDP